MADKAKDHDKDKDNDKDDDVDDKEVEVSTGYRMKKFFASATAGNKVGRKVIAQFVGDAGNTLISAFKHAAVKYAGSDKGKQLKTDVLKLALKAKLLVDEKLLTPKNTMHAQYPINSLAMQFLKFLEMEPGNINVTPLCANINRIGAIIADIVEPPLMQKKNQDKLVEIFKFISDEKFMGALLNNAEYKDEKKEVYDSLKTMLGPLLKMEAKEAKPCAVKNCKELQCLPKGRFLGSLYCPAHHKVKSQQLLTKPNLFRFIDNEKHSKFFLNFLTSANDPEAHNCLQFYVAVQKYKEIANRAVRKQRAELIMNKFLDASLPQNQRVHVDEKELKTIEDGIAEHTSTTVFKKPQDDALAKLEAVFKDGFLKSKQYEQFVASIELPADYAKDAEKKPSVDIDPDDEKM